ncbi:MAG: 50S ribosome-binding GTPase [Planctomycetota bacterium]|nr:50S ribosome-binding GTPase [Planctomycetota bacterium]
MTYFSYDDIVQIGTGGGTAWLGALRLSGPCAFDILARATADLEGVLASRPARSVHVCRLRVKLLRYTAGGPVETILACNARAFLMPAPRSYTCEDMAEVHLPGSPALLAAALASLLAAGAREAAPGEFTFRAFRNGRLGLGQAEAVEDAIRAGNESEKCAALSRLGDDSRTRIAAWRDRALDLAARTEAFLDFPDEELEGNPTEELAEMAAILEQDGVGAAGEWYGGRSGLPRVALAGLANAGKSSLFNRLVGEDASLVSPEASTTHDMLTREIVIGEERFLLSDLPGRHAGGDARQRQIGELGLERLAGEDLVIWVLDASLSPDREEILLAAGIPGRILPVLNKRDLPPATTAIEIGGKLAESGRDAPFPLEVSAATGEGLEALRLAIVQAVRHLPGGCRWSRRELLELATARADVRLAMEELAGAGRLELVADALRLAADSFSRAFGEGYSEAVLDRIFSRFCIGK